MISCIRTGPAAGPTDGALDMDEKERAEQVRRAVQGDGDALQRLIVHYHGVLFATIDGRMDEALRQYLEPDDILQQAYIRAFKSITGCTFDGAGSFYKWLERIALDRLLSASRDLRRKKRDIRRNVTGSPAGTTSYPDIFARLASPHTRPTRDLARQEASAAVISSLARLTDDQRTAVRMRFIEDKPVSEIAAELDKSEAAVYALCTRGLSALKEIMISITRFLTRA